MNVHLQLAVVFAKLGLLSFGGSGAIVAQMQQEVVGRGWLTQARFADAYAVSLLGLGPGGFLPIPVGYQIAGVSGAGVAFLGFVSPTIAMALGFAIAWKQVGQTPWAQAAKTAVTPIVIGLLLASVFVLGREAVSNGSTALIALAALVIMQRTTLPVFLIPIGAAVIGAFVLRP